jgi:peptidoglycan/xylan/chitin deacetylase (PgdA/CDA1 family)
VSPRRLGLKIDVDTERGTRLGVPALVRVLGEAGIPATFFFSLGPDNTGRALRRVFRPGFVAKTARTNVLALYGLKTLGNGVLWPGPHIARRHGALLRSVRDAGFDVAVHGWDHVRWQDGLRRMSCDDVHAEVARAFGAFERVYGCRPAAAGAAGWQANAHSLAAYEDAGLRWASDVRGWRPFWPSAGDRVFRTLQVPTTLPTLDELLGRPEHPEAAIADQYLSWIRPGELEVLTIHAEIEGQRAMPLFRRLLDALCAGSVEIVPLGREVEQLLTRPETIPVCALSEAMVPGRSGTLSIQG